MATPEELDAKIKKFTIISFVWFLAGMGIWCSLGYMFLTWYYDPVYQYDQTNRDLFMSMASIFMIFGIMSLIFGIVAFVSVMGSMKDDRYDSAYNRSLLLGGIGLFFGLGAGIMLILAAKKYLKSHPKYLATLPVPTPICERCGQPVTFDKEEGGWFCPTCKVFLTKGAPKPKAAPKPILPPIQPKPAYKPGPPPQKPGMAPPPKPGYGPPPQRPGMAPPPKPGYGPPPQRPGMAPPPKPGYGPPPQKPGMAPPPKPGYGPPPQKPGMAPPPKPGYGPPGQPQVRNLTCAGCGKTFQWNLVDPSIRVAKCPWCNNQVPL